jgi:hypothetical protein
MMLALAAKRLALVVALALISACVMTPRIHYFQLSALDKGISSSEAQSRLQQPALSIHTVEVSGRTFEFHRYLLNSGMGSGLYFLAFEQNQLIYWGFISEFQRQPDQDLKAALNTLLKNKAPSTNKNDSYYQSPNYLLI